MMKDASSTSMGRSDARHEYTPGTASVNCALFKVRMCTKGGRLFLDGTFVGAKVTT